MLRARSLHSLLGLTLLVFAVPSRGEEPALDREFQKTVRPFLTTYCTSCHGAEKPKAGLSLSGFTTVEAVARDLRLWEAVVEHIDTGAMPPAKAKAQPSAKLRHEVATWVRTLRTQEAKRNAGDPGHVPPRRLSNAEYDRTIRDLTGVDLRPAQEFPVDPANEAGFDNSAESLTLSPALLNKYIEAARRVSEHLILSTEGLTFAEYPVVADTDRDKFCVRQIMDFYRRQRTDYTDFFLAAWQYRHRAARGEPKVTLEEIARRAGVSAKYLKTLWTFLNGPVEELGPMAALQAMWKDLPSPKADHSRVREGCERMREFVVTTRSQLIAEVKNLTSPKVHNGAQPLVLWKNREMAANRRRYTGGASKVSVDRAAPEAVVKAMTAPAEPEAMKRYEAAFTRFCSTFPDTFVVTERARVYLNPEGEKKLTGRLLNAGFHSMTGYFRDDAPLYDLLLDERERRELDRLWLDFDVITGAPIRQHTSFIWFERSDSSFIRDPEFDLVRAEDKDCTSAAKIRKFGELYLAKAKAAGASEVAEKAIADHFKIISASIRRLEKARVAAEPRHLESLQSLAERAYRRPLSSAERSGLVAFYRTLRDQDGLSHEDAVRDTLVSVLVSPHFLFRTDLGHVSGAAPATKVRLGNLDLQPLSDHALASRLSYFLWASMPDRELLDRAAAGDLHRPEVLAAQVRRMLKDDRVRGLMTEFAGNWLDFRRFEEHNAVDRARFPAFTDELRRAMFEEPIRFFMATARDDGSVLDLLDSNHTYVNPVLARHYGMPEVKGGPDDWIRIDDARTYGRGGLLPMAVFLTKNAPGLRTSPVKRGYWVVRRVLGERIPAPPPNVPELPSDEAKLGELTLREVLARHRADKACSGCHERFDSVGLSLEGFGPVGERRVKDLGGRAVDARATFPGGSEGSGLDGLRIYLRERRQEEFVNNLCRQMLAYALGRTLLPSDDGLIEEMRLKLAAHGNRFSILVDSIVQSPQFRYRRGDDLAKETKR